MESNLWQTNLSLSMEQDESTLWNIDDKDLNGKKDVKVLLKNKIKAKPKHALNEQSSTQCLLKTDEKEELKSDELEKREKRRERNKQAAQKSRDKEKLEKKTLQEENDKLKKDKELLEKDKEMLNKDKEMQCKEIEILKKANEMLVKNLSTLKMCCPPGIDHLNKGNELTVHSRVHCQEESPHSVNSEMVISPYSDTQTIEDAIDYINSEERVTGGLSDNEKQIVEDIKNHLLNNNDENNTNNISYMFPNDVVGPGTNNHVEIPSRIVSNAVRYIGQGNPGLRSLLNEKSDGNSDFSFQFHTPTTLISSFTNPEVELLTKKINLEATNFKENQMQICNRSDDGNETARPMTLESLNVHPKPKPVLVTSTIMDVSSWIGQEATNVQINTLSDSREDEHEVLNPWIMPNSVDDEGIDEPEDFFNFSTPPKKRQKLE